jgi:hypothetical protein
MTPRMPRLAYSIVVMRRQSLSGSLTTRSAASVLRGEQEVMIIHENDRLMPF